MATRGHLEARHWLCLISHQVLARGFGKDESKERKFIRSDIIRCTMCAGALRRPVWLLKPFHVTAKSPSDRLRCQRTDTHVPSEWLQNTHGIWLQWVFFFFSPTVAIVEGWKRPSQKERSREVLPTLELPTSTTLNSRSGANSAPSFDFCGWWNRGKD